MDQNNSDVIARSQTRTDVSKLILRFIYSKDFDFVQ
jgi:hypothetical protein